MIRGARRITGGWAALTLLVGGTGVAQAQQRPGATELEAAVDSMVAAHRSRGPVPGLTVGVVRGGETLVLKGYGHADVENRVPTTPETVYRIGSVTKQFTAAAVMKLVEQGRISLSDPIAKFLPEFPTQGHTVTIEQLLNHTSGIRSYTALGPKWRKTLPLELTHEELVALFRDEPFDFVPGTKWSYNNSGYYLLGMVLEKVTGKPYAEHLEETLFRPLGLGATTYCSESKIVPNRAEGYTLRNGELRNDDPIGMNQPGAAGALCSTVPDLLRWQAALEGGRVVTPASYARMTTPARLADGSATKYGYGLQIGEKEGRAEIAHGGGIPGFGAWMARYPADSVTVVVIVNSDDSPIGPLSRDITRRALGIAAPVVSDLPLTHEQIAVYEGTYDLGALQLRVFEQDGKLMGQATGQPTIRLMYQGEHTVVAEVDPGIRLVFAVEDGKATGLTLFQGGARIPAKRAQ